MTRLKNGENNGQNNGGALIPQPHGGALRPGGQPGNAGGTGRPPSEVRATARMMFDERIPALANIADREDTASADRIRALDLLAKVGLGGTTISIEEIRERLTAQMKAIHQHLGADAPALIEKLREVWKRTDGNGGEPA